MDLKQIREELRRLTALVEGWSGRTALPAIERDLALEKLRALYEAVRSAGETEADGDAAEEDAAPVAVPVDLGLADLLPPVSAAVEAVAVSEPEKAPTADPEPVCVEEPEPACEPEPEPVSGPDDGPVPVNIPDPEPEPEPEPAPAPAPTPVAPVTPAIPDPAPASAPEPAPQPVVGSLFGFEEEESLRHRRKQRVIMSLYDVGEPAKPAAKEKPPVREPVAPAESAEPTGSADISSGPAETVVPAATPASPSAAASPADFRAADPATATPAPEQAEAVEEPDMEEIVLAKGSVLGEVINHDVQTLADTIEAPRDMAAELKRREPVTDLERAIGINDKFLMIRDLFNGDAAAYEEAIRTLNGFGELDDCLIHIAEHYAWNPNSDGAKLLMELLERKYA